MVHTDDMTEAYFNCRKRKRNTASAIEFEMNYERNICELVKSINSRVYEPVTSICFVVTRPRLREVFAANFRDRVIHHYVAMRLIPLLEETFSPTTFNCREGKGQLYGVKRLCDDIIQCSENYTKDCYIMKLDIQGFFMSIDKILLCEIIDKFVLEKYNGEDKKDVRYLCKVLIMHEPQLNCERHSKDEMFNELPSNKSLFTNGKGKGIAIGNLFSQIFANYLLNSLDWYLEGLGIKFHGRYVDDFYCIHENKQLLLNAVPKIRNLLKELKLTLHPKKFYIQHYTKGVEFTGAIVKPHRIYANNRVVNNFMFAVMKLNNAKNAEQATKLVSSINSYLGILRQYNEYATRRRVLSKLNSNAFKYIYIQGHFEVVKLKDKYKLRVNTIKRLKNGDY